MPDESKADHAGDDELVRSARSGSKADLERLIARCAPVVRRALERGSGDAVRRYLSVSDLEQEVLLRVSDLLERLSPEAGFGDLRGLVLQNCRWVVSNAARGRRRFEGESVAPGQDSPNPTRSEGEVTLADQAAHVDQRLEDLEPDLAEVVRLRLADHSFAAIAEQLGTSEATARRRFLEAAHRLRS